MTSRLLSYPRPILRDTRIQPRAGWTAGRIIPGRAESVGRAGPGRVDHSALTIATRTIRADAERLARLKPAGNPAGHPAGHPAGFPAGGSE
jgi:hypothetical protein